MVKSGSMPQQQRSHGWRGKTAAQARHSCIILAWRGVARHGCGGLLFCKHSVNRENAFLCSSHLIICPHIIISPPSLTDCTSSLPDSSLLPMPSSPSFWVQDRWWGNPQDSLPFPLPSQYLHCATLLPTLTLPTSLPSGLWTGRHQQAIKHSDSTHNKTFSYHLCAFLTTICLQEAPDGMYAF